jgi:hypothetical protein
VSIRLVHCHKLLLFFCELAGTYPIIKSTFRKLIVIQKIKIFHEFISFYCSIVFLLIQSKSNR